MKKLYLLILCLSIGTLSFSQSLSITNNVATINGSQAGCLVGSTLINATQKSTITQLIMNGIIDATDFKVIRDEMPSLTVINLSNTTIQAYSGTQGTISSGGNQTYPANTVPHSAYRDIHRPFSILLPATATAIGQEAFIKDEYMTSVTIQRSVTTIGSSAFLSCRSLTSIDLPAALTSIEGSAFETCSGLTSINSYSSNPGGITLGLSVFSGVSTSNCVLNVPIGEESTYQGISVWNSFTNIVGVLGTPTLIMNGTRATITDAVAGCLVGSGLMNTTQKEAITHLTMAGDIDASDIKVIRDEMINLQYLDLSHTVIRSYIGTLGTQSTSSVTYNSSTLPAGAFASHNTLLSVKLPSSIKSMDKDVFHKCTKIVSVSIPTTVLEIGDYAFYACNTLTDVNIPSSLTEIRASMFEGCASLTSITLPNTIQKIREKAFYGSGITNIVIPTATTEIGAEAFFQCERLKSFTFEDPKASKLVYLGDYIFKNCTSLTTLQIPNMIDQIGEGALNGCSSLSSIAVYRTDPNINANGNLFINVPVNTCVLRVTEGRMNDFLGMAPWSAFLNVVEGPTPPTLLTQKPSMIGLSRASGFAQLVSIGEISNVECGVVWGTSNKPTLEDNSKSSSGSFGSSGTIEFNLDHLLPGTTYYLRAYSLSNSTSSLAGTTYGNEISFTTPTLTIDGLSATISDMTAGALEKDFILDDSQKNSIKDLTITGTINGVDFKIMRDNMSILQYLNLSGTTITEFDGYQANAIPKQALYAKNNLLSISLPSNVSVIGAEAFSKCESLYSISLPSTLTYIGNEAFRYCNNLTKIDVHVATPIDISGTWVFNDIPINTATLRIPVGSLEAYTAAEDWKLFTNIIEGFVAPTIQSQKVTNITKTTATGNATITNLGDGTPIQYGMVWSTSPYPTIELSTKTTQGIPGSTGAFTSSITGLKVGTAYYARPYITIKASNNEAGTTYGEQIAFSVPLVNIGGSVATITYATPGCLVGTTFITAEEKAAINKLIISGTIDARDFKIMRDAMTSLTQIDLSGATIAEYTGTEGTLDANSNLYAENDLPYQAFKGRTGITSISLPSTIKTIQSNCFNGCSGISSITIPSSVTAIEIGAFQSCTELTSMVLPDYLTKINIMAFYGCSKLASINIPSTVTYLGQQAFTNCASLTSIALPSSINIIDYYMFNGCTKLSSVTIPSSITSISMSAFSGCSSLTSVTLPSSVTTLGTSVFNNCTALTSVSISTSLTAIPNTTFKGCSSLTSVVIPSSVTSIGGSVFLNCTSLRSVTIPGSVTSIGSSSFSGASQLSTINMYSSTPSSIAVTSGLFTSAPISTCVLHIPAGSLSTYQSTTYWKDVTNMVEGYTSPTTTTQAASSVAQTTATVNGNITSLGDVSPIQYGFVWGTSSNPTVALATRTELGVPTKTGAISSNITGLAANTTYYVRSYVTNKASTTALGTTYGNEISFSTSNSQLSLSVLPTIVLAKIYDGTTTATLTNVGTASGVSVEDQNYVTLNATAAYSDANIGTGKTITVNFSLSGTAAGKYIAPSSYVVNTGEIDKELKVSVILQGLWNTDRMNQCMKEGGVSMYTGDVVEHIAIELRKNSSYKTVIYSFPDLELHKDGQVTSIGLSGIALPPSLTGTYYIAVKSRNHLETASAAVVDFKNISTSYDFTGAASKAYASMPNAAPQKTANGKSMIYAGDPLLDSEYPEINLGDLYDVFNNRSAKNGKYGYLNQDLNGSGEVDDSDIYLLFANRDMLLYIP